MPTVCEHAYCEHLCVRASVCACMAAVSIRACVHLCMRMYVRTYVPRYVRACMRTCVRACIAAVHLTCAQLHFSSFVHSRTPCLGNGATHSRLRPLTSMTSSRGSLIEILFPVIRGGVKLVIKANNPFPNEISLEVLSGCGFWRDTIEPGRD